MKHLYSRLTLITSLTLITGYFIASAWTPMGSVTTGDPMSANLWNTLVGNVNDLNTRVGGTTSSQWTSSGANISYSAGNVGIGTASPNSPLNIVGNNANGVLNIVNSSATNWATANISQTVAGGNGNQDIGLVVQIQGNGGTDKILNLYDYNSGSPISRFVVRKDGNVGIGTTSPNTQLDINSIVADRATSAVYTTGIASGHSFGLAIAAGTNASDYSLAVRNQAGTDLLRVRGDGNVGIGTPSPQGKIDIYGGNNNSLFVNNDGSQYTSQYFQNNGTTRGGIQLDNTNNKMRILAIGTTTKLALGTQATDYITMDTTGNVGIGTTSPDAKLHVFSETDTTSENSAFKVGSDTANKMQISLGVNNAGVYTYIQSTRSLDNYKALSLNPLGGNVGIGTPSPSSQLTVASLSSVLNSAEQFRITSGYSTDYIAISTNDTISKFAHNEDSGDAAAGYGKLQFTTNAAEGVSSDLNHGGFEFKGPSTSFLRILNNGNVGIGTPSPTSKLFILGGGTAGVPALTVLKNVIGGTETIFNVQDGTNGGTTRFMVRGDGNVGIGTASPTGKLDIVTTGASQVLNFIATGTNTSYINIGNSTGATTGRAMIGFDNSVAIPYGYWQNASGAPLVLQGAAGKVGIGTPTPNKLLHLKTTTGTNAELDIQSGTKPHWGLYHDETSEDLRFWNGADRVTFGSGGEVGIGTIDPKSKLDVAGDLRVNGAVYKTQILVLPGNTTKNLVVNIAGSYGFYEIKVAGYGASGAGSCLIAWMDGGHGGGTTYHHLQETARITQGNPVLGLITETITGGSISLQNTSATPIQLLITVISHNSLGETSSAVLQ